MELFQAKDDYILQSGDRALWCSRKDGSMTVRPGTYRMTSFPASALASHLSRPFSFGADSDCLKMVQVYLSTSCYVDTTPTRQHSCALFFVTGSPSWARHILLITRITALTRAHEVVIIIPSPQKSFRLVTVRCCGLISGMPTPLWHAKCLPLRLVLRFPRT